ncbi:MAG: hypothetical protein F6K40_16925 [Okeania sp. SIO3I5]|uniref:hypothetical protein n=1 Tax=Okeania sp. SIO3I5 TaxID=2607805 RepID=UPI0013BD1EF3|nr:hypothetical protein [Okeania sp. SIO3I5]NEQ37852.1 hypothetical protein [Okeania sp. SIO3I5]
MTLALEAIKEKNFHHPPPGASANETTLPLEAIKEKNFHHPPSGASANEMTIVQ